MSVRRVLIVEDDPFIVMDIESALVERLGDHVEVIVCQSLSEARKAASGELSCALLDIEIIGGKSFEVAERLRARGTPFAFVSGSPPEALPRTFRDARFMRKPFSVEEIGAFVDDVAGRSLDPHPGIETEIRRT